MKKLIIGILPAFMLYCSSPKKQPEESIVEKDTVNIALALTGKWQNKEMQVEFKTVRGSERDSLVTLDHTNWAEVMKSTPQEIEFKSNGEYVSRAIQPTTGDSLVFYGYWQTNKQQLIIDFGMARRKYDVNIKNDSIIEFTGILDADLDSLEDDKFYGKIVKIK
jgi:hypothetical protein